MKYIKCGIFVFLNVLIGTACYVLKNIKNNHTTMMIRMAEIKIDSVYLEEYKSILKEESEASVRLESGVICIFPMFQKNNPTQIRLLEIYENKTAYEAHLQTPHFQHYKTKTLKMVKSLVLVNMEAIDDVSMVNIFKKID